MITGLMYKILGNDDEFIVEFNPPLTGDFTYHHDENSQSLKCGDVTILTTVGVSFSVVEVFESKGTYQ